MKSLISHTCQFKNLYEPTILYLISTFINLFFDDSFIILLRGKHHCRFQDIFINESSTLFVKLIESILKSDDRRNDLRKRLISLNVDINVIINVIIYVIINMIIDVIINVCINIGLVS